MTEIFDDWPERYDRWFQTPIGRLVKSVEEGLILRMLSPQSGDRILDAGCGTGVFTKGIIVAGAQLTGLELSRSMLRGALVHCGERHFKAVNGDMTHLPFRTDSFDKSVSVTAIEFIEDAKAAVDELFRITQPGGTIFVATLNALSPWAHRRKAAGKKGHPLFRHTIFRSPDEISALSKVECRIETAIHFAKNDDPETARRIESRGSGKGLKTGAFVAACWVKPT